MKRLIVCGATGRMGSLICELALESNEWNLVGKVSREQPLQNFIANGDVIIDFTLPEGTVEYVNLAEKCKKPIVIGTTGLSPVQEKKIEAASKIIPIVYAPNTSRGINLLFQFVAQTAKALGSAATITIHETHHIHKKDAPSGTAKRMAEIVTQICNREPKIDSNRKGEIVGEHNITFQTPFETVTLSHEARSRKVFAEGALIAAKWLLDKSPGLYDMAAVLDLR